VARTRSKNYDDVRDQILTAAAKVFATKGAHAATIIDIGEACKASKSRLYHYFPSKEAVLFEVLKRHVEFLVEKAREVISKEQPADLKLIDFIDVHLQYYRENEYAQSVIWPGSSLLPPKELKVIKALERELLRLLSSLLAELRPRSKPSQPAVVDALLVYGMLNWTLTWYRAQGPVNRQQLARRIADICLRGVVA
jgi:AcrR family transcriptional regulator